MSKAKHLMLLMLGLCSYLFHHAQVCQGTLGAPIVNVTFGAGTNPGPQLSVAVPGATTNYTYQGLATGSPPANVILDGQYSLVNQVPANGSWFFGATDNTGNPNGYMAFFNSAQTPGGEFYRQTVTGLCQGTTYQFQAFIANAVNPANLPNAILPNVTLRILDGNTLAVLQTLNTGGIPMQPTFTWMPYTMSFTVPGGVTSVILSLTNNNVGGNAQPGNDLAIDDITFRPCGPTTTASFSQEQQQETLSLCEGNTLTLYGNVGAGLNTPTYQWQMSTDGGINWSDIAGATTLTYNLPSLAIGAYQFRLLSAESGNIGLPNCRFISNVLYLDVIFCPPVCSDTCFWKLSGNNIMGNNNIFGTLTNSNIRIFSNNTQRGSILANGYFGWRTNTPTTWMHVNAQSPGLPAPSGLRFENLPGGRGTALVVDANGYVYRQGFTELKTSEKQLEELIEKNRKLEKEIEELKALIKPLVGTKAGTQGTLSATANKLYQNKPNPFSENTVIEYAVAETKTGSYIIIYDLTGKELLRFTANAGKGNVTINAGRLSNGMYLYSLIVDGAEADTKKMILSK
ncbi:MAG TPA: T9SS type A sorting domain-containing protein [Chitinophagaceae bacterium]|nr:T9SS type A sorting domain-containing protein [Chitinophagaceae bacterium]